MTCGKHVEKDELEVVLLLSWLVERQQTSQHLPCSDFSLSLSLSVSLPFSVQNSATGTRTRVARVRAEYPNQLDYGGSDQTLDKYCSTLD